MFDWFNNKAETTVHEVKSYAVIVLIVILLLMVIGYLILKYVKRIHREDILRQIRLNRGNQN